MQQTILSFAPETSPQVLGVQPNRIAIVRTDRAMSLSAFNQRYPSVIPLEELALINQLQAGATIPAGTPVKRVVAG